MSAAPAPLPFRLLAIGDRRQATAASVWIAAAAGGARVAFLLRDPAMDDAERRLWALELLAICRRHGSLLIVHGAPSVARAAGSDGVHLPERDRSLATARRVVGERALLGASRHDPAGVARAIGAGADYVTFSPVFATPGKGLAAGVEALAEACAAAPGRVVALGGIVPDRAGECFAAGAAAVAAVRGVWEGSVDENVRRLIA